MQSILHITQIQSILLRCRDAEQTTDNVDTADIVDTVDTADIRDAADTVDTANIEDTADIVDTADMEDTADTVEVADTLETRDPEQIDRELGWITKITSYMNHRRTASIRSQIYSRLTENQDDHKSPVTCITGEDHRSVAD